MPGPILAVRMAEVSFAHSARHTSITRNASLSDNALGHLGAQGEQSSRRRRGGQSHRRLDRSNARRAASRRRAFCSLVQVMPFAFRSASRRAIARL